MPIIDLLEDIVNRTKLNLLHPGGKEITSELLEKLRPLPSQKILEVGCGTGETALYIAKEYGCYVTGVDISQQMISIAKEKAKSQRLENVIFVTANMQELPFKDGCFDIIVAEAAISVAGIQCLRELSRVLKEGGEIGIHDYSGENSYFCQNPLLNNMELELVSLDNWKKFFSKFGFVEISITPKPDMMLRFYAEMLRNLDPHQVFLILKTMFLNYSMEQIQSAYKQIEIAKQNGRFPVVYFMAHYQKSNASHRELL